MGKIKKVSLGGVRGRSRTNPKKLGSVGKRINTQERKKRGKIRCGIVCDERIGLGHALVREKRGGLRDVFQNNERDTTGRGEPNTWGSVEYHNIGDQGKYKKKQRDIVGCHEKNRETRRATESRRWMWLTKK